MAYKSKAMQKWAGENQPSSVENKEYKSSAMRNYEANMAKKAQQEEEARQQELIAQQEAEAPRRANLKDLTLGSIGRGYATSKYGNERYDEIMLGTQRQAKQAQKAKEKTEQEKYNFAAQSGLGKTISGAGELIGQQIYNLTNRDTLASVGANVAGAAAVGAAVPLPEELVTMPTAVARGLKLGSAATMYQISAAQAYDEMVESGVSEATAKKVANVIGAGMGALEGIQADELLKSAKILKGVKGEASEKALSNIMKALGKLGVSTAIETGEEVAQETVSMLGQDYAKAKEGIKTFTPEEYGQRLKDTAVQSALSFGLLGGVGAVGGAMMNRNNVTAQSNEANAEESEAENTSNETKVGKATTIKSVYEGDKPTYTKPQNRIVPEISQKSVDIATQQIEEAKAKSAAEGGSLRGYLKNFYNAVFDEKGGKRDIKVNGVTFENGDYLVTLGKKSVGKAVSDPNLTAEKLSIFDNIDNVIANAEYVGSGKYDQHSAKQKNVTRYDYFETDVTINGKPYLVTFDVEVYPNTNNYRTHKVINKINLTDLSAADVGPVPTATDKQSSLSINTISQNNANINGNILQENAADVSAITAVENRYGDKGANALRLLSNVNDSKLAEFDRYYRAGTANQQRPADSNILSKNEATAAFMAGMADAKANRDAYADRKVAVNKNAGLNMSSATHLTLRERITWDRFAKALGLRISFADTLGDVNAKYNMATGEIIIAKDATNFDTVLVHEIVHRLRQTSPNEFYELSKSVLELLESQGKLEGAMSEYSDLYGLNEGNIEYFDTMEEIVADFMANEVTTEDLINMVNAKPSVTEKLLKIIEEIIYKLADLNDVELKQTKANLQDLHDKMKKAVNASENAVKATEQKVKAEADRIYKKATESNKITAEDTERLSKQLAEDDGTRFVLDESTGAVYIRESRKSYNESVENGKLELIRQLYLNNKGVTPAEADKYIESLKDIANYIAMNSNNLDYEADREFKYLKDNSDYGFTADSSSNCIRRKTFQDTLDAVLKAMKENGITRTFTKDDYMMLRRMLVMNNYKAGCGVCYVDGARMMFGEMTDKLFKKHPELKGKYSYYDFMTQEGQVKLRKENPELLNEFIKINGSQNRPMPFEARTDYRNELYDMFTDSKGEILEKKVKTVNDHGGFRVQSFSDFELVNALDLMQVIFDAGSVGLKGQAYSKVISFFKLVNGTNLMANISVFGKGRGVDENGNLVFDNVQGVPIEIAKEIRNMNDKQFGTCLVGNTLEHIIAAMKADYIDYIIPFHRSQIKTKDFAKLDIQGNDDFTNIQLEKIKDPNTGRWRNPRTAEERALIPVVDDWWDYNATPEQNARNYLNLCNERGIKPKFIGSIGSKAKGTQKNVNLAYKTDDNTVLYSNELPIREGYVKLLVDFRRYDNNGKAIEQKPVEPNFNVDVIKEMLSTYKYEGSPTDANYKNEAVSEIVDEFISKFADKKPTEADILNYKGEYNELTSIRNYNEDATADVDRLYGVRESRKMDAEYMDAYWDGDDDRMQELVDEAAYRAGYKYKAYHHTENGFTIFDLDKARKNMDIQGFYFFADADEGDEYGSVTYDTYLKMENPYIVDSREKQNAIPFNMSKDNAGVTAREWLQEQGYDSVIRKAEYFGAGADEYIVFDSAQIKSAEAMTFEDDEYGEGDIIPLSERFNENEADIRWSKKREPIIPEGYKERGFNESVRTKTDYDNIVQQEFIDNPEIYKQLANKVTKEKAKAIIDKGLAFAETEFPKLLERMDATAIALGDMMAREYSNMGEYDKAVTVIRDMAKQLTKAGQFSQAAVIALTKSNPMTALAYAKRDIDKLNADGHKQFGKKWKDFELTAEEEAMFKNIKQGDADAIKAAYEKINKRIAKEYPSTIWQKFIEASRISMLLNPRTNVKNVVSNLFLWPITTTSGILSSKLQKAYSYYNKDFNPNQQRGIMLKKGIYKQVEKVWEDIKDTFETANKYNEGVKANKRDIVVFKEGMGTRVMENIAPGTLHKLNSLMDTDDAGLMETLRHATYWLLEYGDNIFVKQNFISRFGSYMQAKGITDINTMSEEDMAAAIDVAYREAMRATFKDDTALSKWMASIKHTGNIYIDTMMEMIMPFTKTPANIAMRGIDYSPIGFINTITKAKKGADATEVIDELSKNLLGSALIAFGALLFSKGLVTGGEPENEKEAAFLKQQGWQPYAVKTGDSYTTYDWAQPAAIPIIMGVTIMESLEEGRLGVVDAVKNAGVASFNQWVELSPLQSLKEVMGGYGTVGENLLNTAIEMPQRLIPSALGATARTADTTQRLTYSKGNVAQTQKDLAKSKVPGLSQTLPAAYDTWGNVKKRDNSTGVAAFNQFINPASYKRSNATEVDREIERLYKELGDSAIYPRKASYSIEKGGKTYTLSNAEYSEYQRIMGELSYDSVKALMATDAYNSLTDYEKSKIIQKIYDNAFETAKYAIMEGQGYKKTDKDIKDLQETKIKKVYMDYNADNIAEYYIAHQILNNAESDKTASGVTIAGSKKKNGINRLVELGYTRGEAKRLYERMNGD